jgi:hypothetical protein
MAYEKTTWMTGDTITAEKMNRIEDQLEVLSASSSGTNDITVTLDTANKKYLLGTTTQPAATATSMTIVADSNTYLDATGLKVQGSLASGDGCVTDGANSHAEGQQTKAIGDSAHAEGAGLDIRTSSIVLTGESNTTIYTYDQLPTGFYGDNTEFYYILHNNRYYLITNINEYKKEITLPQTLSSAAITSQTFNICALGGVASGVGAHSEGEHTTAAGRGSHAEGEHTSAIGENSHAEGSSSRARGHGTHAEGGGTEARSPYSHAEGLQTITMGSSSHAEGLQTKTIGSDSHAEGWLAIARGERSHAEGYGTSANGDNSHAEGEYTIAKNKSQHVFGRYNEADSSTNSSDQYGNYIEIVGNGTDDANKSNARTLDWNGNERLAGSLALGQKLTFNNQETPYIHLETPGVAQLGICTDSIFLTRATPTESTDDGEEEIPVVNVDDPTNYGSFNFTFDDLAKLRILCDHYDQIMQLVNPPETNVEVTEPDNP